MRAVATALLVRLGGRLGRSHGESGQVLVLLGLTSVVLLGFAGMAIDVGRFYSERRFLQNAADAAALAGARAITRGQTADQATASARAVLTSNFTTAPNGTLPGLPGDVPVYADGASGTPSALVEGIVVAPTSSFSGCDVRVAIRADVAWTFARVLGFETATIGAQARAGCRGALLPLAVRRYLNGPGPNVAPAAPCLDDADDFTDVFATADTSCLGSETDAALRVGASPGSAFDATSPDGDRGHHGRIVPVLGQGAQPNNAADFRGFIALDLRYSDTGSAVPYNGVDGSQSADALKGLQAGYICDAYPSDAPALGERIAILSGNSAGLAVDELYRCFQPGDEILVSVYPGSVRDLQDYTVDLPAPLEVPTTGTLPVPGAFRVALPPAYSWPISFSTEGDPGDTANPWGRTGLGNGNGNGTDPITYAPATITAAGGTRQTISLGGLTTRSARRGIYALWIRSAANGVTKRTPLPVNVGGVTQDFVLETTTNRLSGASATGTVSLGVKVRNASGAGFGGAVTLTLEDPSGRLGLPAPLVLTPTTSGATGTLSIGTTGVLAGDYDVVLRATGTNGSGDPVTHLTRISVGVGTSTVNGSGTYIELSGYAVMRVVTTESNSVSAYAITPVISDPNDPLLRLGQRPRLIPWD